MAPVADTQFKGEVIFQGFIPLFADPLREFDDTDKSTNLTLLRHRQWFSSTSVKSSDQNLDIYLDQTYHLRIKQ